MSRGNLRGVTLVELVVAMAISAVIGAMLLEMFVAYQSRILVEIARNDLQDRAERLLRFVASDIAEAAFLIGPHPQLANGDQLSLVHDSLAGDPLESLPAALLPGEQPGGEDRLTLVKAVSFEPPLSLAVAAVPGDTSLILNRRPNRSPGSSRELQPAPEAISHLVLASHKRCYAVRSNDLPLALGLPLEEAVSAGTEVLGVRAHAYSLEPFAGSGRLRRDDFTSRDILDDAVDGLQFEYLLNDGSLTSAPHDLGKVRGVRVGLLVRDLRADRNYTARSIYRLGNRSYGPYGDHFRRTAVTQLVEVKNHGLP